MYVVPCKYYLNATKGSSATASSVSNKNILSIDDIEIIFLEIYSVYSTHQIHGIFAMRLIQFLHSAVCSCYLNTSLS